MTYNQKKKKKQTQGVRKSKVDWCVPVTAKKGD